MKPGFIMLCHYILFLPYLKPNSASTQKREAFSIPKILNIKVNTVS